MTRHVVAQLVMFVVISLVAILFGLRYVAGPDTFGDPLRLSAELDNAAGLARGTSVNYRGVGVGTVESVDVSPSGSGIVLGIELHPGTEIPIGSVAKISTENPVGIQSLDIMPTTDQPPYLVDGDVIAIPADGVPKSLDATLVQATDLVNTLDVHDLSTIADTFGTAFQGTGPDLQNLLDNSAEAAQLLDSRTEALTTIVDKGMPLLDSADGLAAALPGSASTARNVFEQLQANDAALVDLMGRSPQTMASLDSLLAGNRDSSAPCSPIWSSPPASWRIGNRHSTTACRSCRRHCRRSVRSRRADWPICSSSARRARCVCTTPPPTGHRGGTT